MLHDSHALERLGLPAVKVALEARTRTTLGADGVRALAPLPTLEATRTRLEEVRQARLVLDKGDEPPLAGATDVRAALDLAVKGRVLDGGQLRAMATTMRVSSALHRFLVAKEDVFPLLYGIGASMDDLGRDAEEIARCFAPDGSLADDASPALGGLRRRLRQLHDAIKDKLSDLLSSAELRPYLQEHYFTVRGDRYVLPVKSSFQNEVKGIVHDASGSGQTVFIEPQAVVDLGNRLKIAQSEVHEEELRILTELTELVVSCADELGRNLSGLAHADLVFACGRLARDLDAEMIVPEHGFGFDLLNARHPELVLQRAANPGSPLVANDIGLTESQRVLVLTGPNTGGKTVAMKTVGLFAIMARAGLHLPADRRSRIGWYESIEVAIGDDQSIATNLSTFAAHMKQIMRVLDRAGAASLVLLDEIAADTDPTQGQSLAQAILEALADVGAHVVVTTHFERLKVLAFADQRFRNAGVGFDPVRLAPTYKLTLDLPQSSSGLDIAQSLGLPRPVVDRARSLLGEGGEALETLMRTLRQKQVDLDAEKRRAEEAHDRLVGARNALEDKKAELERERRRLIEEARVELVDEIKQAREEVRGLIAKLQRVASSDAVREAMRLATDAAAKLAHAEAQQREKLPTPSVAVTVRRSAAPAGERLPPLAHAEVGDWVHVDRLEKDGEVVVVEGKDVVVAVGNMRTRLTLDQLSPARTKRPKRGMVDEAKTRRKALVERAEPAAKESLPPPPELDLRGQTVDDALARLDAFLDVHYAGGQSSLVRLVHGHGTGALKQAIRDHLKRSGYVRSFRAGTEGEGGDGSTFVELA